MVKLKSVNEGEERRKERWLTGLMAAQTVWNEVEKSLPLYKELKKERDEKRKAPRKTEVEGQ